MGIEHNLHKWILLGVMKLPSESEFCSGDCDYELDCFVTCEKAVLFAWTKYLSPTYKHKSYLH